MTEKAEMSSLRPLHAQAREGQVHLPVVAAYLKSEPIKWAEMSPYAAIDLGLGLIQAAKQALSQRGCEGA